MVAPVRESYHHGDLRVALVAAAMEMLEHGEPFSLRAVARRAGVSAAAPYRHFADREALESAVAAEGYRVLKADLMAGRGMPSSVSELAEFAVAYVNFALRRPVLFRLMFGQECDTSNSQRVQAIDELHGMLAIMLANVFPGSDTGPLATAAWGLVHGLAFLHLSGKLPPEDIDARVHSAFEAIFTAASVTDRRRRP